MGGFDVRLPSEIRPYFDAFKHALVGVLAWQHPSLVGADELDSRLKTLEQSGKDTAGVALSKDLADLPPGPTPQASIKVRPALMPLVRGENDHVVLITSLTQFFVGHCYAVMEESKKLDPHRTDPLVQFLRHVRNGCFHGNRFNIAAPPPDKAWKSALWRGKEITLAMNGQALFRPSLGETTFFLQWGDAMLLISDVCALVYGPNPA